MAEEVVSVRQCRSCQRDWAGPVAFCPFCGVAAPPLARPVDPPEPKSVPVIDVKPSDPPKTTEPAKDAGQAGATPEVEPQVAKNEEKDTDEAKPQPQRGSGTRKKLGLVFALLAALGGWWISRPEPTRAPAEVSVVGEASAVDTETIRVGGRQVDLFGIRRIDDKRAVAGFSKYLLLHPGVVQCTQKGSRWVCKLADVDLSEMLLMSGYACPRADAPERLRAAARQAQDSRQGVWSTSQGCR